jgi:hypothetical protein
MFGCTNPEQSEQEKRREQNVVGEFIYRKSGEHFYEFPLLKARPPIQYPWDQAYSGPYVKITKEFFRCRGSASHPPIHEKENHYVDCGGGQKHSLPLKEGQEYIYPILIDLLNYVQEKTGKKVIVTCGHRCPTHNTYSDRLNSSSKHMIGAEVDFYVEGMEDQPLKIVQLLMSYYKGQKDYETFERYDKAKTSMQPWLNKEIFIQLFQKNEGRDFDNLHVYPYISLQVRFDRQTQEKVVFFWPKAFNGYRRY